MQIKIQGKDLSVPRPTPKIFGIAQRLEGKRFWLKDGSFKCENTPLNLELLRSLPDAFVTAPAESEVITLQERGAYVPKVEDYEHQARGHQHLKGKIHRALFMEQGTGKTKTALDYAGRLFMAGYITGILVVSKKGVHRQWAESEIPKFLGCPYQANYYPRKAPKYRNDNKLQIFCINWDSAKSGQGYRLALEFCKEHDLKLLIIADESQEMKNPKSQRYKAMETFKAHSRSRVLCTGTPLGKDLLDEWAQLKWLDEGIIKVRYASAFRAQYCIMGGFQNKSIVGHQNVDRFRALAAPYLYVVKKEDIGILPKNYSSWVFDMLPVQKQMIGEIKRELEVTTAQGMKVEVKKAVSLLSKIQQISNGFVIGDDGVVERLMPVEKNPRVIAVMEWLESFEGKAIVWARFKEDSKIMAEAMAQAESSFVLHVGDTDDAGRKEAISSFMDPEGARVFCASAATAGTGLNLQGLCNENGYFSNSFNSIERWQSEDRTHRIGVKGICRYTDFIAKGSIDRKIVANLLQKKDLADLVVSPTQLFQEEEEE
jgi:hypothetical protein